MIIYHEANPNADEDEDVKDVVESFGVLDYVFAPILGVILILAIVLLFRSRYYSLACVELKPTSLYQTFFSKTFAYRFLLFAAATVIVNINPGPLTGSLYALIIFALFVWDFLARRGDQFCKHNEIQTQKIVAQVKQILPGVEPRKEGILENIGLYKKDDILTDRLKLIYGVKNLDDLPAKIAADPQLVALVGEKSKEWPINPSFDYDEAMGGPYAVYNPPGKRQIDQFGQLDVMYQQQKQQVQGLPDRPKRSSSQRSGSGGSAKVARERVVPTSKKQPQLDDAWYAQQDKLVGDYLAGAKPKQQGWFW